MELRHLTGPNAGVLKYDLLTALSVAGLHGTVGFQISLSRLICLVTARYNWKLDEFCVGQKDMARMWNVNERTVKREVKRWLETKLVICKRQGVRGRVGAYRLNYLEIYRISEPHWTAVGSDFVERMSEKIPRNEVQDKIIKVNFATQAGQPQPFSVKGSWKSVGARIQKLHPEQFQSWIASLEFISENSDSYTLRAKNQFMVKYLETHLSSIINEAIEAEVGPGRRLMIIC